MIPRSDRVFFHVEGSPPAAPKTQPASFGPAQVTPATRYISNRFAKDPRRMRPIAPATPWRPRISRATSALATEQQRPEQPSPLDRKLPSSSVMPLELGPKPDPNAVSPALTSATLAPNVESQDSKDGGEDADACRRNPEPKAPLLEQNDRCGGLRNETTSSRMGRFGQDEAQTRSLRFIQSTSAPAVAEPSHLGLNEPTFYPASRRSEPCMALDQNNETNIYINGLPREMDDKMLYLLGSACGIVISHKAMIDRQTGFCKGFGFLMYATSEMAKRAVEWLNSHGFPSSFAKESFSARIRRLADTSSTNVYLSNLPLKLNEQQLEQLFNPHPIASLKIMYDIHGESRGVGFVRLYDRATAKQCIERLHGRVLPGTTMPLQARFADSEAQKQLKHSVCQKHTLESLGLMKPGTATFNAGGHGRTHSGMMAELDDAVARWHIENPRHAAMPTQFFQEPASATSAYPFASEHIDQNRAGLGIEVPYWAHAHSAAMQARQVLDPASMWAGHEMLYSGVEGAYPLDRLYHASSYVADKAHAGMPVPFIPPPSGLADPSRYRSHAHENNEKDNRDPRKVERNTRVRVPGGALGQRAVSDPMAMLAAEKRVREYLGMPDRVRAAVSADNSIDESAAADDSIADSTSDNDESESLSIQC